MTATESSASSPTNALGANREGAPVGSVSEQVEAGRRYIRENYGRALTPEEACLFDEPDEDPAKIFAAFDAAPHLVTARPDKSRVPRYAAGGVVRQPPGPRDDSIPGFLSQDYVVPKRTSDQRGEPTQ